MKRYMYALGAAVSLCLVGCPAAAPVVAPVVSLVDCVVQAAEQGESVVQIGLTCSASAAQVAEVLLLEGQTNADIAKTNAYVEVRAIHSVAMPDSQ